MLNQNENDNNVLNEILEPNNNSPELANCGIINEEHDFICPQSKIYDCQDCHESKCLCQIVHSPTFGLKCETCQAKENEPITRRSSFVSFAESNFTRKSSLAFSEKDQLFIEILRGIEDLFNQRLDEIERKFSETKTDSGYSSETENTITSEPVLKPSNHLLLSSIIGVIGNLIIGISIIISVFFFSKRNTLKKDELEPVYQLRNEKGKFIKKN